jgi:uncharacterized membrane protein YhhN
MDAECQGATLPTEFFPDCRRRIHIYYLTQSVRTDYSLHMVVIINIVLVIISTISSIFLYLVNVTQVYHFVMPATTILIAILCINSKSLPSVYSLLVLIGLIFGAIGDGLTMFRTGLLFEIGGIAFAVGHIFYIAVMATMVRLKPRVIFAGAISLFVSVIVLIVLWEKLGEQTLMITAYTAIITVALWMGIMLILDFFKSDLRALLLGSGIVIFYISDVVFSIERFVFVNSIAIHLFVLVFYFTAQTLIALSCYKKASR